MSSPGLEAARELLVEADKFREAVGSLLGKILDVYPDEEDPYKALDKINRLIENAFASGINLEGITAVLIETQEATNSE